MSLYYVNSNVMILPGVTSEKGTFIELPENEDTNSLVAAGILRFAESEEQVKAELAAEQASKEAEETQQVEANAFVAQPDPVVTPESALGEANTDGTGETPAGTETETSGLPVGPEAGETAPTDL